MSSLLLAFIVSLVVIFIMVKQINSVTGKIDQQSITNEPSIYSNFAGYIQEKIRTIKTDIDSTKNRQAPTFLLINEADEEKSLEFLADTIRKLVFFETMNSRRKNQKEVEAELFEVLQNIEEFLQEKIQNGDQLAENLRDELFNYYTKLQNET